MLEPSNRVGRQPCTLGEPVLGDAASTPKSSHVLTEATLLGSGQPRYLLVGGWFVGGWFVGGWLVGGCLVVVGHLVIGVASRSCLSTHDANMTNHRERLKGSAVGLRRRPRLVVLRGLARPARFVDEPVQRLAD